MHILIIHQAFASLDEPGGTRHAEFARYLAANGHQVTIIASPVSYLTGSLSQETAGNGRATDAIPGVNILRARVYSAHHRSWFHRMLAFFSFMVSAFWQGVGVRDVDLVWGTSPPIFQGLTASLLAALKRVPFLFEVRDLWPEFAIAVGVLRNPLLIAASNWLERFLYRRATCVMVNSPGFAAHVSARGARRVELVPNGADPSMFDPTADGGAFRSAHGLGESFVALYAGAHGMSNDLQVVLEAAELLREADVRLVFVGDGKDKTALVERAHELRLENVVFAPAVPKREMPSVLAAADAGIAILKPLEAYKTTYPNKVFDYMAAGRPVILVIDGVIREVVEDASCGVFVPPGDAPALADAIRGLARDRAATRQMGARGRQYLRGRFSREDIANHLLGLLESLGSGDAHGRGD
jgi:glycosyltransferase involved in cell wall biosynthesis